MFNEVKNQLSESMIDKNLWGRSLLLLWSAWIFIHLWRSEQISLVQNPFYFFDHDIHEIGHWITRIFGMWISVASGTIFQLIFPWIPLLAFVKERDFHAAFFIFTWMSSCLYQISWYSGSAAYSDLQLLTPHYITLYHDWVWMLSRLNAIDWAGRIENFFLSLAWLSLAVSVAGQMYCLYLGFTNSQTNRN